MIKRFSFLLAMVMMITLLSGCGSSLKASLNSQFTLAPGQSARIDSEGMDIRFIGVTEDSRCAKGVECIWAGQVSCAVEITKNNIKNSITLTDSAGSGTSTGTDFQNYHITFSVSPYPVAGQTIQKGDYRLSLTVSQIRY
jgi:hypothetical protein